MEDLQLNDYVPLYIHGSEAYRNEDFQSVIGYIEESLDELLKEEEECRAFCEGPFDQGWFPDFVSSISKSALNRIKEAVTECAKDVCGSVVVKETVREKKDAYKQMTAVKSETERKRLWDLNKRKRVMTNAKTVVKESKEQIRLKGERMLNNFEGNKQFWEWKSSLQVEAAYPSAIHAVGCGMYDTVKNLQKACEAVSSYLLFFPNDETMLSNKKFYLTMPKVKPEYFTPRKEAINYIKRQQYEEALLNYIEKEFTFEDASDNEVSPSDSKKVTQGTAAHPTSPNEVITSNWPFPEGDRIYSTGGALSITPTSHLSQY
ncbi:unnamed protein product [Timema podura]|uniref:Leprecan-like alpha-helical domain-containing protein n=1 Tax=Timema podura TaxID=61482 RepID=A0ABN7NN80_TIMPD|nr:unnamed protein product [Timema podura]